MCFHMRQASWSNRLLCAWVQYSRNTDTKQRQPNVVHEDCANTHTPSSLSTFLSSFLYLLPHVILKYWPAPFLSSFPPPFYISKNVLFSTNNHNDNLHPKTVVCCGSQICLVHRSWQCDFISNHRFLYVKCGTL